jgi:hypothetical protein
MGSLVRSTLHAGAPAAAYGAVWGGRRRGAERSFAED